jgi:ATP-binding cassette subfamily C protein CydD
MAAIDSVVAALPQGLATRLGETGGGLSGGEARRITLARAIHGAPDLILADEPTADLDAGTAAMITDALLAQAARGATLVVATHDAALAARMDRIIDLGAAT